MVEDMEVRELNATGLKTGNRRLSKVTKMEVGNRCSQAQRLLCASKSEGHCSNLMQQALAVLRGRRETDPGSLQPSMRIARLRHHGHFPRAACIRT